MSAPVTPTTEGKQLAADLANAAHAEFGGSGDYFSPDAMCASWVGATGEALARLATEHLALKAQLEEALADLREIGKAIGPSGPQISEAYATIRTIAAKYRVETDPLFEAMKAVEPMTPWEPQDADKLRAELSKRGYEIGAKS